MCVVGITNVLDFFFICWQASWVIVLAGVCVPGQKSFLMIIEKSAAAITRGASADVYGSSGGASAQTITTAPYTRTRTVS